MTLRRLDLKRLFSRKNRQKTTVSGSEENLSRKVRAGSMVVLSYEERREQLKGTRLGEILGLNEANLAKQK